MALLLTSALASSVSAAGPQEVRFTLPANEVRRLAALSVGASYTAPSPSIGNPVAVSIETETAPDEWQAVCSETVGAPTLDAGRLAIALGSECRLCAGRDYRAVVNSLPGTAAPYSWTLLPDGRPDVLLSSSPEQPAYVKGDLDGDLCADLIVQSLDGPAAVFPWAGRALLPELAVTPAPAHGQWIVGSDDFNHDHKTDLVLHDAVSGRLEIWLMDGRERIGGPAYLGTDFTSNVAATGDFNHDGWPDLVLQDPAGGLRVCLLQGTVVVGTLIPTPSAPNSFNWRVVGALDHNGDGNLDLLLRNSTSGRAVLWLLDATLTKTAGYFLAPSNPSDPPHPSWTVGAVTLFGDSSPQAKPDLDIVWYRWVTEGGEAVFPDPGGSTSGGAMAIWIMGGGSTTGSPTGGGGGGTVTTASVHGLRLIVGPR